MNRWVSCQRFISEIQEGNKLDRYTRTNTQAIKTLWVIILGYVVGLTSSSYIAKPIARSSMEVEANETRSSMEVEANETMTVCADRCSTNCKVYKVPLSVCFNPTVLWPGDKQWGDNDILDLCHPSKGKLNRTFFRTKDSSCHGYASDSYELPLRECVGPFGKPRPWGTFDCP